MKAESVDPRKFGVSALLSAKTRLTTRKICGQICEQRSHLDNSTQERWQHPSRADGKVDGQGQRPKVPANFEARGAHDISQHR